MKKILSLIVSLTLINSAFAMKSGQNESFYPADDVGMSKGIEAYIKTGMPTNDFSGLEMFINAYKDYDKKAVYAAMALAGHQGNLQVAKFLIAKYPFASSKFALDGLLRNAARFNQFALVKFAVEKGANVNGVNGYLPGNYPTPLQDATSKGNAQIADYLRAQGAK